MTFASFLQYSNSISISYLGPTPTDSFGLMISPAYYIPMSIFSIEFGGPFSATLICLIDAFGFAASASFGFIGGRLADGAGGWPSFMNMLILLSVIATASVWMFMHREYKASIK